MSRLVSGEPLVPGSLEAQVLALLSFHTWEATYIAHGATCFCGVEGIQDHDLHVARALVLAGLIADNPARHEYGVRFNEGMSEHFGPGTVVPVPSLAAALVSVRYDSDNRDLMVRGALTDDWNVAIGMGGAH
jgi:hypothetical protein